MISSESILAYFAIGLTVAQNLFFYGSMRFRAPIEPLLILLTGGAFWWFTCDMPGTLRNWRKQNNRRRFSSIPSVEDLFEQT